MPRSGTIGNVNPYRFFGTFAGLPFWGGGLTLLAAAPGVGKTSWAGRMILEAAIANIPAALVCYEHTAEELKFGCTSRRWRRSPVRTVRCRRRRFRNVWRRLRMRCWSLQIKMRIQPAPLKRG